jgi:hypothetical protein
MANPSRESRKYTSTINLLEDFPGADISQDAVRIVLVADQLQDDLDAKVTGTVDVQEDTPLDVSGAVVDVQEDTPLDVSGATLTVTDDGSLEIADSNGNTIEEPFDVSGAVVNVQEDTALDVSGSTVTVTDNGSLVIDSANQGTLPVEQQTPVGVEDGSGTQVDPINQSDTSQISDSTTTAGNNVSLNLGDLRESVDVIADVSGSATLTITASTTGNFSGEQHDVLSIDYTSSGVNLEQIDFAYQHIRASVDSNLNELEIVSRGI